MSAPAPLYYEHALARILGLTREDLVYLRGELLQKKSGWVKEGRNILITAAGLERILDRLRQASNQAFDLDFSPALFVRPALAEKKEERAPGAAATATPNRLSMSTPIWPLLLMDRPAPPAGKTDLVELKVKSLYPNTRLLRATLPDGRIVDVRVRTNKNFVVGMKLKARLGEGGKYDMEGRCPRQRGRY